jgi:hypothetical protein
MTHPSGLSPRQIEDYLHRSYTRVDGLWFMLAEEKFGFDNALALDEAVWKVLPKIQARLLREQLGLGRGLPALAQALRAKLSLDRYTYLIDVLDKGLALRISTCPWHELLARSGRSHLGERIGSVICGAELPAFSREFDCTCVAPGQHRLCGDGQCCSFSFAEQPAD